MKDLIPEAGGTFISTTQGLIDKNPSLVSRFLRALFYTIRYMENNQSEAAAFAAGYLKLSNADAGVALDFESFKVDGTIDTDTVMAHEQLLIDAKLLSKPIPPSSFIDQRWLIDTTPILP
jgi:ABC-type nitrate/sulfonate/bicarbonate transport system substrate-binding protein